jgi:hypothetical protein
VLTVSYKQFQYTVAIDIGDGSARSIPPLLPAVSDGDLLERAVPDLEQPIRLTVIVEQYLGVSVVVKVGGDDVPYCAGELRTPVERYRRTATTGLPGWFGP